MLSENRLLKFHSKSLKAQREFCLPLFQVCTGGGRNNMFHLVIPYSLGSRVRITDNDIYSRNKSGIWETGKVGAIKEWEFLRGR